MNYIFKKMHLLKNVIDSNNKKKIAKKILKFHLQRKNKNSMYEN
jgi:hypothetical protein